MLEFMLLLAIRFFHFSFIDTGLFSTQKSHHGLYSDGVYSTESDLGKAARDQAFHISNKSLMLGGDVWFPVSELAIRWICHVTLFVLFRFAPETGLIDWIFGNKSVQDGRCEPRCV